MTAIAASTGTTTQQPSFDSALIRLGHSIRKLRKARGLTLVQLAERSDLSHSFLSQVERGLGRLSMSALYRVAEALGTTQQDLLLGASSHADTQSLSDEGDSRSPDVAFFSTADATPVSSDAASVRVLAQGDAAFAPMYYAGVIEEGEWWVHDEDEFIIVLHGRLKVEIGDVERLLGPGQACQYRGSIRHRWYTIGGETCQFLVVKERRRQR